MARLENMVENQRIGIEQMRCPTFSKRSFTPARALNTCRVALISTAGLMRRGEDNVAGNSNDYRKFDKSCQSRDIIMNHLSVNFDRTAFAEDMNTVLPIDILKNMADDGTIEKASDVQYSFMGATNPEDMQENVTRLAQELKDTNINTACLLPV